MDLLVQELLSHFEARRLGSTLKPADRCARGFGLVCNNNDRDAVKGDMEAVNAMLVVLLTIRYLSSRRV